jgi:chromosome segregation ATPase
MDIKLIEEAVKKTVDASLTEKERAKALADMQGVLETATAQIESLTKSLEEKSSELDSKNEEVEEKNSKLEDSSAKAAEFAAKIEELKVSLSESDGTVEGLQASVEQREQDITELTSAKEALEQELAGLKETLKDIEEEKALAGRLSILKEAKILRTGDAAEVQKASVKGMTEEAFTAYVEELKSLREEFTSGMISEPEGEGTQALASLPNIETKTRDDIHEQYKKLGDALASEAKENFNKLLIKED